MDFTQKKSKALVLAAFSGKPFISRNVDISDAEVWCVKVSTVPTREITDEVEMHIELTDGAIISLPVKDGINISGKRVTASLLKEIKGSRTLTILLEAVNGKPESNKGARSLATDCSYYYP